MIFRKKLAFLTFFLVICSSYGFGQKKDFDLDLGGAVRFNYRYKAWDEANTDLGGDFVFDVFRLNVDAKYKKLFLSAEYRFYSADFGGGMLKHGYVGYNFSDASQIQIGVNQVPFGVLPYQGHSWFYNIPYYLGFEDDYDAGVKWLYGGDSWDVALAYYKNSEGGKKWLTFSDASQGYGVDPARYSYDVSGDNEEVDQFNARFALHNENHEVGISAQYGKLFNHVSKKRGEHHAFAIHYDGSFLESKRLKMNLQAISFQMNPEGGSKAVEMAAYNFTYDVASKGNVYSGGLAYTLPVRMGPISSIQFYENYSYFQKNLAGFNDSQMNVVGMMLTAGPVYTYVDYAAGKNQDWFGPWGAFGDNADRYGLGKGEENPEWHAWFNINIGYYF